MKKTLSIIILFFIATISYAQSFDGYTLYNTQNNSTTYLLDKDYNIAHSWSCNTNANYTVFLKPNGNLVRQGVVSGAELDGSAAGGILQEYDKDGNVVWEFTYSSSEYRAHHDFAVLPNGNVILGAWEVKTAAEMAAAGYTGNDEKWPTHLIEVEQDGTGGKIVWEWHAFDHMIQDVDASKPNYGVVADHPELLDINVPISSSGGPGRRGGDWLHCNGIDYNAELDQIALTFRYLSEVIIIDHSTTTAEAAGHTGGNSGKGGDFLFRYGKPANYGSSAPQQVAGAVHDPRWIKDGRPNAGYIQFFNNVGGPGGSTVIDAINPVMNGSEYAFTNGSFQPTVQDWRHTARSSATGQSASDRLSNGNVFVCLSRGYMYEEDTAGNVVWQYAEGPQKAFRYECHYDGIIALLNDPCGVASVSDQALEKLSIVPNPSTGKIWLNGLSDLKSDYTVKVFSMPGQVLFETKNATELDLSGFAQGTYLVKVEMAGSVAMHKLNLTD